MRDPDELCALLVRSSLLKALPDPTRRALAAHLEPVGLEAGAFVFFQSDPGDALYLVESGRLRVFRTSPDGRDRTLAHLAAGDVLGEMALLDGLERSATVQAVEATRLWRLRRKAFLELLRTDPELSLNLIQILARRLREADHQLEEAAAGPVPERLLRVLRRLALQEPVPTSTPPGTPQRLRVTQDELASMVATTRESVNRALGRLETRGLVLGRHRGGLLVDRRRILALFPEDA
ncbi:Crp/Fnr family transcriptional regulator [Limnochorda pilosa]|uniref:Crp/Fnr family transcriptional regulator n=1 Tax=Limnochorda pilosa TaxID=1555112 RepID=A0A0K2SIK2_LIMPI|nr:Crp/Fnr family transcriptional regulator [Limnochorda pilosa]BAS26961.1 Crp/Fnr family transcriptional regulator [Limnochorda pilosa]